MNKSKDYQKEHMAKVMGRSISISTKYAIEIGNYIRGKELAWAKAELEKIIAKKAALPLTRFNGDRGHKPGMGPGGYPVKACENILMLLNSAEANAQFLGLNTSNLIISKIVAAKAAKQWHYGRQRRRQMKRTNVEIIIEESKKKAEVKKETKPEIKKPTEVKKEIVKPEIKKEAPKTEAKKEEVKVEEKKEVPKVEEKKETPDNKTQKPNKEEVKKEE